MCIMGGVPVWVPVWVGVATPSHIRRVHVHQPCLLVVVAQVADGDLLARALPSAPAQAQAQAQAHSACGMVQLDQRGVRRGQRLPSQRTRPPTLWRRRVLEQGPVQVLSIQRFPRHVFAPLGRRVSLPFLVLFLRTVPHWHRLNAPPVPVLAKVTLARPPRRRRRHQHHRHHQLRRLRLPIRTPRPVKELLRLHQSPRRTALTALEARTPSEGVSGLHHRRTRTP